MTDSQMLEKTMNFFNGTNVNDFWIGLTNLISDGKWTWMDSTKVDYTDWTSGGPQNDVNGNCSALSLTQKRWNATDCFQNKPYVCKVAENQTSQSTTPWPISANCSWPFIYFAKTHSCYGIPKYDGTMIFDVAQEYCKGISGFAASVHSYEELEFVRSLVYLIDENTAAWTSGGYGDEEWRWGDGTPWDFNGHR
uniref:C-type lectin domain-containing protein n=1 Tax=Panagrolaimus davidi TaxID=227884 RepID=A0A914QPP3_9BILA